ncbi:MAG TPA: PrgI family protein [Verrucomicrobiae bacterium]|nr:PrgI family protein [Verrucomicrobiae bacterium]
MPEKFVVPQFIDNEDKILGPITVRQFLICLGATLLIFIAYRVFTLVPFIFAAVVIAVVAGVFGFLKVNGQPFHLFFVNVLQTVSRPPKRVWNKEPTDAELRAFITKPPEAKKIITASKIMPESSRLRDLALTVNTGGVYNPEEDNQP